MRLLVHLCSAVLATLLQLALAGQEGPQASKTPRMHVLHEDARIYLFEHLLSDEECDHIIKLAEPRLHRSGVGMRKMISDIRTSHGTFLEIGEDAVVADIEERIARWTLLPVGNGERLQVLRYTKDQKYEKHFDTFSANKGLQNGGNRYATVLIYLNTPEEGGETAFPNIPAPGGDNGPEFSECARYFLAAKPVKGSAVLFHSFRLDGSLERRSLHTACPVIRGVKWSAPKWIHMGRLNRPQERQQGYGGEQEGYNQEW